MQLLEALIFNADVIMFLIVFILLHLSLAWQSKILLGATEQKMFGKMRNKKFARLRETQRKNKKMFRVAKQNAK